jgi:Na+-driven multidrug efflux pump
MTYPALTMMLNPTYNLVNLYMIAHFPNSTEHLVTYGIATLVLTILFVSFQLAFNSGMTILVIQAFGAGNLRLCGLYLNRQIILNLLNMIPLSIIVFALKPILTSFGYVEEVAGEAAYFCMQSLIGYIFFGITNA